MISWTYLGALIVSLLGLFVLDWRYKLAFFHDARRSALVIMISVIFFTLWDLAGIWLDIFHSGHSVWMLGVYIMPDYPIEELFFLTVLSYVTLLISRRLQA